MRRWQPHRDTTTIGVKGTATNGTGVYGTTTTGLYGVRGDAGTAPGSAGVLGYTNNVNGVAFGTIAAAPATVAGYFNGITVVNGDFGVTGHKSAVVKDRAGNHRLMYCVEAPESWFEDVGTGTLSGGKATIPLDPDFAALIHTDTYHVFLTEYSDNNGLYVDKRTTTGFEVHAKSGSGSGSFSWRLMAKRADVKGKRLAKFTMPTPTMPEPIVTPDIVTPVQTASPPSPSPAPAPRTATTAPQTSAPNAMATPTTVPPTGPAPPRRP